MLIYSYNIFFCHKSLLRFKWASIPCVMCWSKPLIIPLIGSHNQWFERALHNLIWFLPNTRNSFTSYIYIHHLFDSSTRGKVWIFYIRGLAKQPFRRWETLKKIWLNDIFKGNTRRLGARRQIRNIHELEESGNTRDNNIFW
jgi:hypothetical protein